MPKQRSKVSLPHFRFGEQNVTIVLRRLRFNRCPFSSTPSIAPGILLSALEKQIARVSMLAVLSVGSTEFVDLVHHTLHPDTLAALRRGGYTKLLAQIGRSPCPEHIALGSQVLFDGALEVNATPFDNDIDEKLAQADLVIAHAGVFSPSLSQGEIRADWTEHFRLGNHSRNTGRLV